MTPIILVINFPDLIAEMENFLMQPGNLEKISVQTEAQADSVLMLYEKRKALSTNRTNDTLSMEVFQK